MSEIYQAALQMPWAMEESWLPVIMAAAQRNGDIEAVNQARELRTLQTLPGNPLEGAELATLRDGVAIIPVFGPIIPRASLFSRVSALTSTDLIARDFRVSRETPGVHSIILNMDTPGGASKYINELSEQIYQARGQGIRVLAYVGASANSAGYWIASATEEIVIDATGNVGSIGVMMAGEKRNQAGVLEWEIISSQSPKKNLDPTSEAGRADYQRIVNEMAQVFIETVARNRDVSVDTVLNEFGQGSIMVGESAVAAGMADRIGSLEGLIDELSTNHRKQRGAMMTTENLAPEPVAITRDLIATQHPDIAESFRAEGRESVNLDEVRAEAIAGERQRIAAITALSQPGFEASIQAGIDNGDVPETVAMSILTTMQDRGVTATDIAAESTEAKSDPAGKEDNPKSGNWDTALSKAGINK